MAITKAYGKKLEAMIDRLVEETAPPLREVKRARIEGFVEGCYAAQIFNLPRDKEMLGPGLAAKVDAEIMTSLASMYSTWAG